MSSRICPPGIVALLAAVTLGLVGCPAPEVTQPLEITEVSFTHTVVLPGETITMAAVAQGPGTPSFEWTAEAGEFATPTEASTGWTAPETEQLVKVTLVVSSGEQSAQHSLDLLVGNGTDHDGDGFTLRQGDCDDTDDSIYPGAPDVQDSVDNDCDGTIDEGAPDTDDDGDGFADIDGDCDDGDASVYPGAPEEANDVDDDCDHLVDEGTDNHDDDGDGYSENEGDCNDSSSAVSPSAPETLDGVDNNCNGVEDEGTAGYDDDGDGFTELEGDCNDDLSGGGDTAFPGGVEAVDGLDNDCDGLVDEDFLADLDGDGWSVLAGDCDDENQYSFTGGVEFADGEDNDCDGAIDEDVDTVDDDGDGLSEADGDCDDTNAAVSPSEAEVLDTPVDIDNDCDGFVFSNPPFAVATSSYASGTTIDICTTVDLDATGSWDPDADPLVYYWYFAHQPINSLLENGDIVGWNTASASFEPDVPGLWTVSLIVSDATYNSQPDSLSYPTDTATCP